MTAGDRGAGPEAGGLGELARELQRLARTDPGGLAGRVAALGIREQAELALRLPPEQRVELLLHAPKPMRLVRSLPDADLYLTVRDVGPHDALPLLALASADQLLHLLDLEAWRGDRFDGDKAGAWIALLVEAGEPTLVRVLRAADDELLALLFQAWLRVEAIEPEDGADIHGPGESETGSARGLVTPDGDHRMSPTIPEHAAAAAILVRTFYGRFPDRYQRILWAALGSLPSELEEAGLRWRQSRLEEHGFPTWEEALSIYAPPAGARRPTGPPAPADADALGASRGVLMNVDHGPLVRAVDALPDDVRDRVLFEMLALANRVLVADARDTGDPDEHRAAMRKAALYVTLGIEGRGPDVDGATVLADVPAVELFREGYARVAALAAAARLLENAGWPSHAPQALALLDAPIRQRVEGLLAARPAYYAIDPETGGGDFRDFASTHEIDEAGVSLEMAGAVGAMLIEHLGLDAERLVAAGRDATGPEPTLGTILCTLLAWHATRGALSGEPLPPDVVADFLRTVASRRTADAEAPGRALDGLLRRLAADRGVDARQAALVRAYGRFCLERLVAECGSLDPGVPVDPYHVSMLLLARG